MSGFENMIKAIREVVMINDIHATNTYLNKDLKVRKEEVDQLVDRAKASGYKARYNYLAYTYSIKEYHFKTRMLLFSLLVFSTIVLIYGLRFFMDKISDIVMYILLGTVVIIYLFVVIIAIKDKNNKTQYNWNRYYFTKPDEKK